MTRVPPADRRTLARNLGRLAADIDSEPLSGARRMVEEAYPTTHHAKWAKRKRLIRLPGDDAPDPAYAAPGEYESSGASYDSLAEAAGRILAPSSDRDAVESIRNARRRMLLDTSLIPPFEPRSTGERNIFDLLREMSDVIGGIVGREARLTEFWQLLDRMPISLVPISEEQMADCRAKTDGVARIVPDGLAAIFLPPGGNAVFETSNPGQSFVEPWIKPVLPIGRLSRTMRSRIFVLPEAFDRTIMPTPYLELPQRAIDWLRSVGFDGHELPPLQWSDNAPFGWRDVLLTVQHEVSLVIARQLNDSARLLLEINGPSGGYATFIWGSSDFAAEVAARQADDEVSVDLFAESACVKGLFRPDWAGDQQPRCLGLFDHWNDYTLEPEFGATLDGWVDDGPIAALLVDRASTFHPSIEVPRLSAPCPDGSIAAALLCNLGGAAPEQRIDRLLSDRARIISEAAFRYHDSLVDHYAETIRRISKG